MRNLLKVIGRFILTILGVKEIIGLKRNALRAYGWEGSARKWASIDRNGDPIPWITYPAIDILSARIHKNMRVFEFGSGNSTLWWGKFVREVNTVEHDQRWYEKIKCTMPTNVDLKHIKLEYGGEYCKSAIEQGPFDIIMIDGRDRVNCLKNSIQAVSEFGVLILDNSDRDDYKDGIEFMLSSGFKQLPLRGLAPIVNYISETSIFYRDQNCLGL